MSLQERTANERLLELRDRYVARGVAVAPIAIARAEGAWVEDADGRRYLDFAGGIGCQNTGHGHPDAVAAIHDQVDRYLHQCFMVGMYEPYVEVCRRLAELSPCRGADQKTILVNSGAEALENAVKIARVATGRTGVIVFDHAFHGRTLLTMTMTSKLVYKKGFGPFAPEVYRTPAPYPYRGVTSDDAIHGVKTLFKSDVDPESVACVVLEPVQGEGGFIPMPADFPARLRELCDEHGILYVDDEVQSGMCRTGPRLGDRALRRRARPDDDGQVDRRRAAARRRDRPGGGHGRRPSGRARRHVRGEPGVLRRRDRRARHGRRAKDFRQQADRARRGDPRAARRDRVPRAAVGEVRGLGPMLALELVEDRDDEGASGDARGGNRRRSARARALPALLRAVLERDPDSRAADRRGRTI